MGERGRVKPTFFIQFKTFFITHSITFIKGRIRSIISYILGINIYTYISLIIHIKIGSRVVD